MNPFLRADWIVPWDSRFCRSGLISLAGGLLVLLNLPQACWAQTVPMISSVTPTNGAVDVSTNTSIVFVFDQDMNTAVTPIASKPGLWVGNFAVTPTNLSVSGKWSTDKRT